PLPAVYRLSVRRGKAWVYSTRMLLGSLGFPFIFFMGFVPGVSVMLQSVLFVAFIGLPMAAVYTFPNAITADIIDYDELRTGVRREGVHSGSPTTGAQWGGSQVAAGP